MANAYEDEELDFLFDPTDEELINYYLTLKLIGQLHEDFIVEKNVYATEPWLMDHNNHPFFKKNEWFYFTPRMQHSNQNIGRGKNSKRMINDESGGWRGNGKKDIKEGGLKIGTRRSLTYQQNIKNNKKKQRGLDGATVIVPGSNLTWLMTEYELPLVGDMYQELVLCKIYIKKNNDHDEAYTAFQPYSLEQKQPLVHGANDYEASTSNSHEAHDHEFVSSQQQPNNEPLAYLGSNQEAKGEEVIDWLIDYTGPSEFEEESNMCLD